MSNENNVLPFKILRRLENSREVTIGVNRNHANSYWSNTTLAGKIFNMLTGVFVLIVFVLFFRSGWWVGLFGIVFLVFYVKILNYVSSTYTRRKLLDNEELFNAAYDSRSITVRFNERGEVWVHPVDWRSEVKKLIKMYG